MNVVATDAAFRVTVASRFNEDPDYFQMRRATVGGARRPVLGEISGAGRPGRVDADPERDDQLVRPGPETG